MRKTAKPKSSIVLTKPVPRRSASMTASASASAPTNRAGVSTARKPQGPARSAKPIGGAPSRVDTKPHQTPNKLATMIALLRERRGATIARLINATGWQAHSVRGAISGAIKKKHGLKVESTPSADGRVYRIVM